MTRLRTHNRRAKKAADTSKPKPLPWNWDDEYSPSYDLYEAIRRSVNAAVMEFYWL